MLLPHDRIANWFVSNFIVPATYSTYNMVAFRSLNKVSVIFLEKKCEDNLKKVEVGDFVWDLLPYSIELKLSKSICISASLSWSEFDGIIVVHYLRVGKNIFTVFHHLYRCLRWLFQSWRVWLKKTKTLQNCLSTVAGGRQNSLTGFGLDMDV